jgi:YD repeat-containing protein
MKLWRYILMLVCLVLFLRLPMLSAQEVSTGDICSDLRFLMRVGTTPDALLQGGGVLPSGLSQNGRIGPNDIGDHWIFQVESESAASVARIHFDEIPPGLSLEFAIFYGGSRVAPDNHYTAITSGQTYSLPTSQNGIYTVVVQLRQLASVESLTQAAEYRITANYEGESSNINAVLRPLRDEQTGNEFTLGRDFRLESGTQMINFPSGAEVRTNPNGIRSLSTRPNAAAQLFFEPQGSLLVDSWAKTISTLDGNLSVTGSVDESPRLFYVENYGYEVTLTNPLQSGLNDITDSNGTRIATDWENISGIWLMSDCVGFKLIDGRTFTAVVDPENAQRKLIAQARPPQVAGCSNFYVSVDALDSAGAASEHIVCFTWDSIENGAEISLNQGVLSAHLIRERKLTLQSSAVRMQPIEESSPLPLDIVLEDQGASIRLDWENLQSFEYRDESLSFAFLDSPRTRTTRDGANLLSLEALGDVIHIVYQGENARELLMLPAEESYIELMTPAGEPTFNGSAFDGRALPDEPGYQPRALNNLGGECYPVNTLLEEANCVPNGHPNPANGNLWYSITDHIAYNPVFDLALTRSYNSYDYAVDGPFGLGWTSDFPLDYRVHFNSAANARVIDLTKPESPFNYRLGLDLTWAARGIVTLSTASGSRHAFVRNEGADSGEVYVALTMPGWALSRAGATRGENLRSNWTLTQDTGLTYRFDRAGRLRSLGYPAQGHQISITYPWSSNLNGPGALGETEPVIISDDGLARQLELYYDSNHHIIRSILRDKTLASPNSSECLQENSCFETTYSYTNGLLTGVVYPGGQAARYEYDLMGRLIRRACGGLSAASRRTRSCRKFVSVAWAECQHER